MVIPDLEGLLELAKLEIDRGKLPSYIPLLAQVDPQMIAIAIYDPKISAIQSMGDTAMTFPLMSVVKPFLLLYLLETWGSEQVWQLVDCQASLLPFNVIPDGKPPNPMLNCGAIALASLLTSCDRLRDWLYQRSEANLSLDAGMLASVRSVSDRRNLAIASRLQDLGIISNFAEALTVYEEICCLRGHVEDLAKIGALLINVQDSHRASVLEIMTTCGMYAASAEFAADISLPTKSSVSGALLAIVPDHAAIACYSPTLDAIGNSVAGMFLLKKLKAYLPHI